VSSDKYSPRHFIDRLGTSKENLIDRNSGIKVIATRNMQRNFFIIYTIRKKYYFYFIYMFVKIDIDVVESIISNFSRRDSVQTRLYGLLMGNLEGDHGVHIKNCVFGILSESENTDKSQDRNDDTELATTKVKVMFL